MNLGNRNIVNENTFSEGFKGRHLSLGSYLFLGILWVGAIAVILCFIGLIFQGGDFFIAKIFLPKYEQLRYDTFRKGQAYNEGMAKTINDYKMQYDAATDPNIKAALSSSIRQQTASWDLEQLRPDLRSWILSLGKN